MLSDEEKEAIEELKNKKADYFMISNLMSKTLLILIEKQSKEIEELNSDLEVFKRALTDIEVVYNKNYTSNDKIKAKIEPKLKELDEQMKKEWKEYGNSREYQDMEDEWNFLQSLLEKE